MFCFATLMGAGICVAQKPAMEKKEVTTVFATDLHCESCAKKIMDNVPALGKGIKDVKTDVASKTVTVLYDASKNSDENIIKGLASLKVKAEPVTAAKSCCGKGECADKKDGTCCKGHGNDKKEGACGEGCKGHDHDKKKGACGEGCKDHDHDKK